MNRSQAQQDVLDLMTEGFITLDEGRERFEKAGGQIADFIAFAREHRSEILHGDPITGEEHEWPAEYETGPQKASPKRGR
jgi:hypothetical protein